MKFAIMFAEYAKSIGFDITHWRKSVDETKVLVHLEFALTLAEKSEMDIYDIHSPAFKELLASSEWTKTEYVSPDEMFRDEEQV